MISSSLLTQIRGWVRGLSVVAIFAMTCFVFVAFAPIPNWLKLGTLSVFAWPVLASAWRGFRGGEEGPFNLELTQESLRLLNIPQSVAAPLTEGALRSYTRSRHPMPRPAGTVKGNPADDANLIADETASLPLSIQVSDKALALPQDAAKLE